MSDFIQIYRDLFLHPSVISSPPSYRCVLFTILAHACYAPCQQDDHGKLIDLKPGQLMCTIRGLADLANVGKKDVEHALARFTQIKILGQEVGHRKTILTVLWGIKLNNTGTNIGTKVGQDRDIKEEDKKIRTKEDDVKRDRCRFFECLLNDDRLSDEDRDALMKFPEDRVDLALKYSFEVKATKTLIAQLIWHCSLKKPPMQVKKNNFKKEVREKFKHGEVYNGAECYHSEDAIAFQRGMKILQLNNKEGDYEEKFNKILDEFGINY